MPEVADVDGLGIHYLVQGEGEPVVLVHGWPTHSALWRHQMPALAERFRGPPDAAGYLRRPGRRQPGVHERPHLDPVG